MRLTDYFIKKRVCALAALAAGRRHASRPLDDARRVLVLYEAADAARVEPCLARLREGGQAVETCVYVTGGPEPDSSCLAVHAKRDVSLWQFPSDALLERFKAVEADILIDLTRPGCYPMLYLMLQHPCGFKVGAKQEGIDLYDLSISLTVREDIGRLFEHILFYLRAIRSK
ncbi:hypothetical protein [Parabacteroides sp. ZJ-118]|uniref:DUF6913 domain-containing protein n=1 Tax=Parabacteroides sp. ZJ-118 TaxID=2709398 RepID=UPI0013EE22A7|nr:hypothetical protein [Parabacteroides sp. ZJ-118]